MLRAVPCTNCASTILAEKKPIISTKMAVFAGIRQAFCQL
jgi:hypothetical protein